MADVHTVAKEIGVEVMGQGEKLRTIDANIVEAKDNVEDGNAELEQANNRANASNKYLLGIFGCVLVMVVILIGLLIYKH